MGGKTMKRSRLHTEASYGIPQRRMCCGAAASNCACSRAIVCVFMGLRLVWPDSTFMLSQECKRCQ